MFRLTEYRYLFRPALLRPRYFQRSPVIMSGQVLSFPNTQQIFDRKEKYSGCEESLSLPAEEGYGYYPSAVVGHRLSQYEVVRKVCVSIPSY